MEGCRVLNESIHKVGGLLKDDYHTRMANSALKCRLIILITASSLCNYNNILINFG